MTFSQKRWAEGELPITRDGRKVQDLFSTYLDVEYCMVAWIEGEKVPVFYKEDGTTRGVDSLDLIHPSRTREVRVVLYYSADGLNVYSITEAECYPDTLDKFIDEMCQTGRLIKIITELVEE